MSSTRIRVNEPGSTQVFKFNIDEDNGLSISQLDPIFRDICGIGFLDEAGEICV